MVGSIMVLVIDTVRFIFSQMRGNFPSTGSLDFMDSILSQFSLESEHLENSLQVLERTTPWLNMVIAESSFIMEETKQLWVCFKPDFIFLNG